MSSITSIKRFELLCVRERVAPYQRRVQNSRAAAALVTNLIGRYDHERLVVLMLDAKSCVFGYSEVARGGLLACAVHPVDVFRNAVHQGAPSIIVAHNHPSEDPAPSDHDKAITQRLKAAGELLGISLLDHVIVTSDPTRYASLADLGEL